MAIKRPYPESYRSVHHRAPRVARLADGRLLVLGAPGLGVPNRAVLHLCAATSAREGFEQAGLTLVAPQRGVFPCKRGAELVAGIWCDRTGRAWLAWSDSQCLSVSRTRRPVRQLEPLSQPRAWTTPVTPFPRGRARRASVHLGSGVLQPPDETSLLIAALQLPEGRIILSEVGGQPAVSAVLQAHPQNHSPTLAVDPDGRRAHVVWDTEDLRICYRAVELDKLRAGAVPVEQPTPIWTHCHHPDVASNGREIIVAYTDHMQYIKYGFHDGKRWHRDRHLTTGHPRFSETIEHSPWFWMDDCGSLHLSFICLTRCLAYDAKWLGDGFADPQPVDGLLHPSLFLDEVRVKAEELSLDRRGGAMLLASSFLPERHGVYTRAAAAATLRPGEPLLFLDMEEVAQAHNVEARLDPMRPKPAEPILEPTGRAEDFDGARVLDGGTVLKDGGRYRMWYAALPIQTGTQKQWYDEVTIGYAESADGIVWRRTDTGLNLEFAGHPAPHRIKGVHHNACVFADPSDHPARRYKAIQFETRAHRYDHVTASGGLGYLGLPRRGWLGTSADGFHWSEEEILVEVPGPDFYSCTPQKAFYDPRDPDPSRRFKAIGWCALVGKRRGATLADSADCRRWVVAERSPLLDSMAAVTPIRPAGPYAQIHDASLYRYGRYLLAFYGYQFDGQSADIRLAVSRDGERFHYVLPETPLIARGEAGTWNSGYLMPVDLVVEENELVFYYGSSALGEPESTEIPPWRVCAGRAVARLDGFVRISPRQPARPAILETVPLALEHAGPLELRVNARLSRRSQLRISLVEADSSDRELANFETASCQPLGGDNLRHLVRWKQHALVPQNLRRFRVRLHLHGSADDALYSLTFRVPDARRA